MKPSIPSSRGAVSASTKSPDQRRRFILDPPGWHVCRQRPRSPALHHRRHPGHGYPGPPECPQCQIMGTTSDPMYGAPTVLLVLADMENPQCLVRWLSHPGQPHERRCVPAPRLMLDQPGQRRIRNARRESPPQRMGPAGTPRRRRPLHRRLWRRAGTGCRSAETRFHQIC